MYIAPSSGHELFNLNLSLEIILMRLEAVFYVWSENAALLNRYRISEYTIRLDLSIHDMCCSYIVLS